MSSLPPSKRTPFAKIPEDVTDLITKFSPSSYNIEVEVYSEYDKIDMHQIIYEWGLNPNPDDVPTSRELGTRSYTAEQVRNSTSCIEGYGYLSTPASMSIEMNYPGAPQTFKNRCEQFNDIVDDYVIYGQLSPNLDLTITRNYDTNVEGIDGPMSVRLLPLVLRPNRIWNTKGVSVHIDSEESLQINFKWEIPCPLSFTTEYWNQVHGIMRKDFARLAAKFMKQLFSPFLPSAPLNSTSWKLSNTSSLDVSFWSDIIERNKNQMEKDYINNVHNKRDHVSWTTVYIQIQNNRSTRLNKSTSVVTEKLKF